MPESELVEAVRKVLAAQAGRERVVVEAGALRTPLCPAGHLPHKGGDQPRLVPRQSAALATLKIGTGARQLISPLEGEMAGRTEGRVAFVRSKLP